LDFQSDGFELYNGSFTVDGTFKFSDTNINNLWLEITPAINGTFIWPHNGTGNIPSGFSWGLSSTLKFTGITNAMPSLQADSYNNLEIDCSGMTANVEISHTMVEEFTDITITNTGSYAILTDANDLTEVFGDLTIGASGKLIIGAADKLTVDGTLTNSATSADLVIESNSSRTGSLNTSSAGVAGTFKQYFTTGRWYLVSPPFSGITNYDFWDGTNDAFMKPYNSPGGGWGDYYSSPATTLNVGEGYEYWQTTTAFTFNEAGTFITGNQTLDVTSGGSGDDTDWNLIGNPYPCGLDWAQVGDRTNVEGSAFYVSNGSSYLNHNGTSGTASSAIIPPMQGFFVQHTGGDPDDIDIQNSDKAHAGIKIYKSAKDEVVYSNHFKIRALRNGHETVTVLYQQDSATNGNDHRYDAPVLFSDDNSVLDIYTLAGDKQASINIYNEYPYSVNLGFRVPSGGATCTIEPFDFRNLDGVFSVLLEDLSTGETVDFIENPSYTFTLNDGGIVEDRIILHLNSTVATENLEEIEALLYSNRNKIYFNNVNSLSYDIEVIDILGKEVYNGRISNDGLYSLSVDAPSGYYIVHLIGEKHSITKKLFIAN